MTSADMSEFLRVTRDDHVAVLTIDRPEKRNAMTAGMWTALPGVLAPLADDAGVRTLIVTGAGASFCAGADISDLLSGADPDDPMADVRRDNLAAQAALREFPKPTVAMIRGHCIGGGVEIAASCDLRFTDPTGVFGGHPGESGHRLHAEVDQGTDRPGRAGDDEVPALQR
jgi:enoyl-CoA hydratase/carnithine racemase